MVLDFVSMPLPWTAFKVVFAIVCAPAMIAVWSLTHGLGCWALAVPTCAALMLLSYARRLLQARRDAIADAYFESGRLIHAFARSRIRVAIAAVTGALLLTLLLFSAIPFWSDRMLLVLAVDAILVVILYVSGLVFGRRIGVRQVYRGVFARSWAVGLNTPLLMGAILVVTLHGQPPEYIDPHGDFAAATSEALEYVGSNCVLTGYVLGLGAHAEAARWTGVDQVSAAIESTPLRWGLWLVFLINGALVTLAYGRLCAQFAHLGLCDLTKASL